VNPALSVSCAYCGALAGQPCRTRNGRLADVAHAARVRAGRDGSSAGQRPNPDHEVGRLLVDLADRFAAAWSAGNLELAERWAATAFTIRGSGVFTDRAREVDR
jgi:hypothetical protein